MNKETKGGNTNFLSLEERQMLYQDNISVSAPKLRKGEKDESQIILILILQNIHQKIQKPRHILASKPSYQSQHAHGNHGHYQVPVSHNGPVHECFTSILLHFPIPFLLLLLILAVDFNHPTGNFIHSCTKHITSIRFKIN